MIAITNGKIVTPDAVVEDKVVVLDQDRIAGFVDSIADAPADSRVVNAYGRYIIPGIIDTHSDKIEHFIQPRPTSQLDFEFALKVCERDLLGAGITMMYHSVSLFKDEIFGKNPLRTRENVLKIADLISCVHLRDHLVHHRFHLRLEIDNLEAYDIVKELIDQGKVHQISFMDHTPGQGQYRDLEVYHQALVGYDGGDYERLGFEGVLAHHQNKDVLSLDQLKELTEYAHAHNIPVASHDDDTREKVDLNTGLGVDISEFPITLDTAQYAKEQGHATVIGAPNVLRGNSHSGNLSAAEAILEDCADIICSDYYPAAILHSVFLMHTKHGVGLPEVVKKATLNPARAMRIDEDYGSIEIGKKGDLLIVEMLDGYPVITHVFIDGKPTSRVEYRR